MNFYPSTAELVRAVEQEWMDLLALKSTKNRSVALSGGRVTRNLFTELTSTLKAHQLSMHHIDFFWADERCVPPSDPDSNFSLASETLLAPLSVPPERIHRIPGELPAAKATAEANAEIARIVPKNEVGLPMLDLVILGMGENAHVASLCPNASEEVINCPAAYLYVSNSPKPPPDRISLSYAAITAARNIWVLISGEGKAQALRDSLAAHTRTPLGRILRLRRDTRIFTDIAI